MIFVSLIFGFCVAIVPEYQDEEHRETMDFGYVAQDECVKVNSLIGDNPHGEEGTLEVQGHTINWEWLEGGAEVAIDGQKFVIMRFRKA